MAPRNSSLVKNNAHGQEIFFIRSRRQSASHARARGNYGLFHFQSHSRPRCRRTRSPSPASTSASCTVPWSETGLRSASSRATRACSDTRCASPRRPSFRGIIIITSRFGPCRAEVVPPDPIPSPSRRAGSPLPASTTPRRRARSSASPRRRTSAWSSTHPPCRPANGPPPRSPSLTTRTRARGTSTSARRWAPGTARSWLSWRRRR